mgnify:FL=1
MRYETRRRLETIARTLSELGETDNARALSLRLRAGTAVEWLRGGDTYGEHVWAEIGAVATFAFRYRHHLPAVLSFAAAVLERAYAEADALLADEPLPRPAAVPEVARPTVASNVVVLVPRRSTPPRAA